MRIVIVTPTFFPSTYWGGPTTAMYSLCSALAKLPNVQIEVVTTDAAGPSLSDRIAVSSFPMRLPAGFDVYYCRRQLLVSVSPGLLRTAWARIQGADIVHLSATYSFPTLPVLAMARVSSKPLVWSPHGALIPWRNMRKPFLKSLWNRACLRLLDPRRSFVHVSSDREASGVRTALGMMALRVIPFGVDVPSTGRQAIARRDHALRLLFLGRLDPIKGLENLLHALSLDASKLATLSICGSGRPEYTESLTYLVSKLGLESRVRFNGHVEGKDKLEAFANADALVLPSHSENFGFVVAEALAQGLPVVASKGTPWSAVETEECGLWVDNSPESLAAALGSLSSVDLALMGEKGRRWVAEKLSWGSISQEMLVAYEELLNRH